MPLDTVSQSRTATAKQWIVAGGMASSEQIDPLHALRIDAVVGMAIYTGRIKLSGPRTCRAFSMAEVIVNCGRDNERQDNRDGDASNHRDGKRLKHLRSCTDGKS
jgi:hypothetical protein